MSNRLIGWMFGISLLTLVLGVPFLLSWFALYVAGVATTLPPFDDWRFVFGILAIEAFVLFCGLTLDDPKSHRSGTTKTSVTP